jgi:hypothetical protein
MNFLNRMILFIVLMIPISGYSQELSVVKDLRSAVMKFDGGKYVSAEDDEELITAYFFIEASAYSGNDLRLTSHEPFVLFVNGQLAGAPSNHRVYDIDSLRHQFGVSDLQIAMYFQEPEADFASAIVSDAKVGVADVGFPRSPSAFRDFVITAILILLIMFVTIIRLNTKLTSDYFSISKIFTLREVDDGQNYSRITSSSNILFYIFCSMMAGFCLTVIYEFILSPGGAKITSLFWSSLFEWLVISVLILALFFLKILMVYTLSSLFGLRGVGGIHFFYWIRIIMLTVTTLTVILFIYFVLRGQNLSVYSAVLGIISFVLISIAIPVFLKLMRKAECSIFHLFSYICATEIIPFLITIKLLHQ